MAAKNYSRVPAGQPSYRINEEVGTGIIRDIQQPLSVAIIGIEMYDPALDFSAEFCQKLREALESVIDKMEGDDLPLFEQFKYFLKNYIRVVCLNQYSKQWLIETVKQLSPFMQRSLVVMEEENVPKCRLFYVYIPEAVIRCPYSLMNRIKRKAPELKTEYWKIEKLQEDDYDQDTIVKIKIDTFSIRVIEKLNYMVYFGMGRAFFWDCEQKKGHPETALII